MFPCDWVADEKLQVSAALQHPVKYWSMGLLKVSRFHTLVELKKKPKVELL